MLLEELRGAPAMRRERCQAFAEMRLPPEIELPPTPGLTDEDGPA
jgi:hypothetical protein